ncbi:hypothetical protein H5410_031101, partial [Solanum commersonii]
MQRSLSQGRTQCMLSPIDLPIKKVFSRLVMGLNAKGGVPFFSKSWARWGFKVNYRVIRRARPSSPNDP